jgi:hypothetical protein
MNGSPDIILKLFDTLKESTDKNERTMQTLINQQQTLVDKVRHMPIDEIKQDIKDHIVSAQKERKGISDKIDNVNTKVTKMIIVVLVSFVIITGGFMFIRSAAEYGHHDLKRDIIEELKTE